MSDRIKSLFPYNSAIYVRKHGPKGYARYQAFKPWLRDEFCFRCIYCLCRETWALNGEAEFAVEHFLPKSKEETLICEYGNLYLACNGCNSAKLAERVSLNPCDFAMADHIKVNADGSITAMTAQGAELVQVCHLDREKLRSCRRRMISLFEKVAEAADDRDRLLGIAFFGFPENLPDLVQLDPPGGNSKPEGKVICHFAQKQRDELGDIY